MNIIEYHNYMIKLLIDYSNGKEIKVSNNEPEEYNLLPLILLFNKKVYNKYKVKLKINQKLLNEYNKNLNKYLNKIPKQIKIQFYKEIQKINKLLVIANKDIRNVELRKYRKQLKSNGIIKIPEKTKSGKVRNWKVDTYIDRAILNNQYNYVRDELTFTNDINQIYRVVHLVNELSRPLCLPYNMSAITYGNPQIYRGELVRNIYDTSYGLPAGLFGVNCRHFPIPIENLEDISLYDY